MSVWSALVGQAEAVEVLSTAALTAFATTTSQRVGVAQSWLVVGPVGSGRSPAARAFAAALQCDTGTGCGQCRGCRQVLAGSHPDVRTVVPDGLSLGVADVRALVRDATMAPLQRRARVVVVTDADRLTEPAADALLKALEEPPPRTVFLLCAPAPDDLPPTVRSRCRLLRLHAPAPRDVAAVLVAEGVDPAMAAFAAHAAQGHVGRARWLATDEDARRRRLDVLSLPTRLRTPADCQAAAADLMEAAAREAARQTETAGAEQSAALKQALGVGGGKGGRGAKGSAGAVKELERQQRSRGTRTSRDTLDLALVDLAAFYRDVLAVQLEAPVDPVHADQTSAARTLAAHTSPAATLRRVDAVLACREAVAANVAPLLAVEAMALALARG